MSGREWKPGDVGVTGNKYGGEPPTRFLVCADDKFRYEDGDVSSHPPRDDARPLVVIDPEDRDQVARLADAFCSARWSHQPGSEECDPLTRSSMKMALDDYLTPPTPPEPTGLGAVVEDTEGEWWVRFTSKTGSWWRNHQGQNRRWSNIAAVRVLSEGVTP